MRVKQHHKIGATLVLAGILMALLSFVLPSSFSSAAAALAIGLIILGLGIAVPHF